MGKSTNNKYGHKAKSAQKADDVKPTVKPAYSIGDKRMKSYVTGSRAYNAYREDVIYGDRQGEKLLGRRAWDKKQQEQASK